MRNGAILGEYFSYLAREVENRTHSFVDYSMLLKTMFDIPFEIMLEMDENRVGDVIIMREDFVSEAFGDKLVDTSVIFDHKVSVFEIILAISKRMEHELCDPIDGIDHSSEYFWELLRNLDVEKYSNARYKEANIRDKCEKFSRREYKKDGSGGIFPLKNARKDQRCEEIWSQMQSYLMENY